MCTADAAHASGDAFDPAIGRGFGSVSEALALAGSAVDYLNSAVAGLDGSACGDLLIAVGEVQAKLTAAHAGLLRRFDAADAHDGDGYGSSSAWLAAKAQLTRKDARAAVREMRRLGERPGSTPRWPPGTSPGRGPWPSRTGRGSCPRRCATRPTASSSTPPPRARP